MTFLEAAIEILRRADGALHFSEVAKRAVDEKLLSHVGRDPEAAMRTCLNSAVRGRNGEEAMIVREKPGHYSLRPGVVLPEPPPRPMVSKKPSRSDRLTEEPQVISRPSSRRDGSSGAHRSERRSSAAAEPSPPPRTRSRPRPMTSSTSRSRASDPPVAPEPSAATEPPPPLSSAVEFEAPVGSGLEGVTDVALVMANAMSRLVEVRPELKDELHAMQRAPEPAPATPSELPRIGPRGDRSGGHSVRPSSNATTADDRGGRRRRRRRRRGKRVDWSAGNGGRGEGGGASLHERLLDGAAAVLQESGPRSLHVRQIAETLAVRGVLGGEISEIERAVTAALLLDIQEHGRASRFAARGDARYQMQGTRLPDAAAAAEQGLRLAIATLERETENQLVQWLQALGARSLESLVRMYLQREGYGLVAALPPARGIGKLVVEDIEADEEVRALALIVPRRTPAEPKLWEGEVERNGCSSILLFAMGEVTEDCGEARLIGASELATWLKTQRIGVQTLQFEAHVLDMTVIESIGGLDT